MSKTKYVLTSRRPPDFSQIRRFYDTLKDKKGTNEFTQSEALVLFRIITCNARAKNRFNSLLAGDCIAIVND